MGSGSQEARFEVPAPVAKAVPATAVAGLKATHAPAEASDKWGYNVHKLLSLLQSTPKLASMPQISDQQQHQWFAHISFTQQF